MAKYAKGAERAFQMTTATPVQPKSSDSTGWAFSAFLLTVVPLTIFNGLVLSVVWNWFIPSTFDGAPLLSIAQALGVSLVVSTLVSIPSKDTHNKSLGSIVLTALLNGVSRGLLFLVLGFIYQLFIYTGALLFCGAPFFFFEIICP